MPIKPLKPYEYVIDASIFILWPVGLTMTYWSISSKLLIPVLIAASLMITSLRLKFRSTPVGVEQKLNEWRDNDFFPAAVKLVILLYLAFLALAAAIVALAAVQYSGSIRSSLIFAFLLVLPLSTEIVIRFAAVLKETKP